MSEYVEVVVPPQTQDGMPYPDEEVVDMGSFMEPVEDESLVDKLNSYLGMVNIAESLEEDILREMGSRVVEDFKIDKDSRADWEERTEDSLLLAGQVAEKKYYAGEIVANVKYPTLATASIQFASRAMPNIIKGRDVVKVKVIGAERQPPAIPDGIGEMNPADFPPEQIPDLENLLSVHQEYRSKSARAERISKFMSYQFLEEMGDWRDSIDQLLVALPVVGCAFKKTYYDSIANKVRSPYVSAEDLVVNYNAKSIEDAPRITHVLEFKPNEIEERVRSGVFLDKDLGEPDQVDDNRDDDAPHVFLEQHRWWDLDDDGYQEPYIVTVHKDSSQVVRITARFDADGIITDEKGKILMIKPVQYFTMYSFMPAFDGNFYRMGLGSMMSPLNATINTTINQLLDAGTRANRQGGFLGKGVRLGRNDMLYFKSGEWKSVNNTGDDLRKGIVPLPTVEPSPTLFQLLSLMIEASKEVSSVQDVLTGEQQGANQSPTTTMSLIEQGLKVFSSIYDRVHRSLKSEFHKVWRLNRLYLDPEYYMKVLDDPDADISDFYDKDMDVVPVSNESELSHTQKMVKAEALMGMVGTGLNDREIQRRYLEAMDVPDVEKLLPAEGEAEKIPPEIQLEMDKLEIEKGKLEIERMKAEGNNALIQSKIQKNMADIERSKATAMATQQQALKDEHMKKLDSLSKVVQMQTNAIEKLVEKVLKNEESVMKEKETEKKKSEKENKK